RATPGRVEASGSVPGSLSSGAWPPRRLTRSTNGLTPSPSSGDAPQGRAPDALPRSSCVRGTARHRHVLPELPGAKPPNRARPRAHRPRASLRRRRDHAVDRARDPRRPAVTIWTLRLEERPRPRTVLVDRPGERRAVPDGVFDVPPGPVGD